jgi:hypothetical protein
MAAKGEYAAPSQQLMEPSTDPRFQLPKDARPFFQNLDAEAWAKWEAEAKPPATYAPPQMEPGYLVCSCINWWNQRSPLFAPNPPCCPVGCSNCAYTCCVGDHEYASILEPDAWMAKMLSTGTSPNCPERMKGIWWMHDNIAAHEHLLTFHDAEWATEKLALKTLAHNWSRGPTCFGAVLFTFVKLNGNTLRIEISPGDKWITIGGSSGDPTWIYMHQEGEEFPMPDGSILKPEKDDMMRISTVDDAIPNSKTTYQYRLRRIAYLDDAGNLVKTPAYEEIRKAASEPLKYPPCCCGYCFCRSQEQLAFKNFPMLPSHTVIQYAPPPPGAKQ